MNLKHRHHSDFGKSDRVIRRTYHPLLDGKFSNVDLVHLPFTRLLQGLHVIAMAMTWDQEHYLRHC